MKPLGAYFVFIFILSIYSESSWTGQLEEVFCTHPTGRISSVPSTNKVLCRDCGCVGFIPSFQVPHTPCAHRLAASYGDLKTWCFYSLASHLLRSSGGLFYFFHSPWFWFDINFVSLLFSVCSGVCNFCFWKDVFSCLIASFSQLFEYTDIFWKPFKIILERCFTCTLSFYSGAFKASLCQFI